MTGLPTSPRCWGLKCRVALLLLIALVAAGCSSRRAPNHTLILNTPNGQLFVMLAADGVVTDSKGQVVARYDDSAKTVRLSVGALSGTVIHTDRGIVVRGPRVVDVKVGPLAKYRFRVTESNELLAIEVTDDGAGPAHPGATESTIGHLEGYKPSDADAEWLGVMVCGLTVAAAPRAALVLLDAKGRIVEQMSPDGVIRDHLGGVIARYVAGELPGEGTVKDASSDQTLKIRVAVQGPRDLAVWPAWLDFGYRIQVTEANEIRAQRLQRGSFPDVTPVPGVAEEPSGRVEGYVPSRDGAYRFGAMLYVLSSVEPHDPEARLPLEQQPLPPPPPPRQ